MPPQVLKGPRHEHVKVEVDASILHEDLDPVHVGVGGVEHGRLDGLPKQVGGRVPVLDFEPRQIADILPIGPHGLPVCMEVHHVWLQHLGNK